MMRIDDSVSVRADLRLVYSGRWRRTQTLCGAVSGEWPRACVLWSVPALLCRLASVTFWRDQDGCECGVQT